MIKKYPQIINFKLFNKMDLDSSSILSKKSLKSEKSFIRPLELETWRFINLIIYIWINLVMGSALSLAIPFASKLQSI